MPYTLPCCALIRECVLLRSNLLLNLGPVVAQLFEAFLALVINQRFMMSYSIHKIKCADIFAGKCEELIFWQKQRN